ncbi:MAG: ARMT1-like domain-containing protein [Deltaproteobacteria bacterium]|nr:ARMT1-like domain-containing protein [Deltaproteobacteria bacterium]
MKTCFECIPCLLRQTLEAARLTTDDETIHEQVLRKVLRTASEMNLQEPPPLMAQRIHRLIRQMTGDNDPYRDIKDRFNHFALELYPELKERIEHSREPLDTAIRLAIAGNIIDSGINYHINETQVHSAIEHALTAPLAGDQKEFCKAVSDATDILYLADNAGEIVFDRLLIKQMPLEKITLVVKGSPVINDACLADAQATGIADLVEVIDNGSDAPGTILGECSEEFKRRFENADLIIAKGQGNYETLSDVKKDIFFVLKAKCPVIAQHIGCEKGSLVFLRSTMGADYRLSDN